MLLILADDSSVMRRIVLRTLRQAGLANLEVLEAPDGAVLVDLVLANDPDLVLSDWNMPRMTGLEALKAIRSRGSQVPFGFITSEGSDEMRQQATNAGASFLLVKPFTADGMRDVLSAYV
jgi:two-component system, chemotaxis family, chemotaxis protein CheY